MYVYKSMYTVYIYIHITVYTVNYTGWWFQHLWKILVNGKEYPIYEMETNAPNHQKV